MGESSEPELDELEKILGEIPNVTSGNPNCENCKNHTYTTPASICVKPSGVSFTEKHHSNGTMDNGKMSGNKILQSPIKRVRQEGQTLPDEQSLASAFSELRFGDGVTMHAAPNPSCAVYHSIPSHSSELDEPYRNSLRKHPSVMDSRIMVLPSPQTQSSLANCVRRNTQECSNVLRFGLQDLKKQQPSYAEPFNNFTATVPFTHGPQGFQFFPDMPVPNMEYPVIADQQQFILEAPSRLQYMHSQQLSQPHIAWSHMEEENYYRMNQQYLYWQQQQQMRNQSLEAHHPIQANENVTARLISHNLIPPHYGVPVSNQHDKCCQNSPWNNYTKKGLHQSNPAISCDYHVDKVSKQIFPEKILTRSHGLNTIRSAKFGCFGGNGVPVSQNGRALSNGNSGESLPPPNGRHLLLKSLISQGLCHETTENGTNQRVQPPKYSFLDEVRGKIYLMAKDQNGCRYLQRKFTEGTPEDVKRIFLEIIDHIVELMTDPFGNYLVQKLLEVCDEDQRMQILRAITRKPGDLLKISCDMHGTRAVQKVIETLKTAEQFSVVVSSLKPGIVSLIKNMNGNHVAQRCLQYLVPEYSKFLFEAAIANCVELATDRHGCCVLQKCLGYSDGEERHRLICEITSNTLILSQDPFGNYVVQFVLELQVPWATKEILDQLQGNFGDLSMQKCSSNVVEKCLKYAGEERRSRIIQELIENPRLDQIMQDPYGNYVIQAAINLSKGAPHGPLVEAIRPHIAVLRTSPYGKKVLSSYSVKK